jgi:hypothetical protein
MIGASWPKTVAAENCASRAKWLCLAKTNFSPATKLKWNKQLPGQIACFGARSLECIDLWSFCIADSERNGIQNRGRGTIPASVLELAELFEGPKERPFQTPFVASELP